MVKDSRGNRVNGTIDYNSEYDFRGTWINSYATFTPAAPGLDNGATYTVYLNGMTDPYGQVMSDYSWSFTTKTIPVVVSASPANGATGVLPGASITVRFSEDMDPTSVRGGFKIKDGANQYIGGNVIVAGNTSTFVPSAPLANGKSYTVSLNGLTDLQNNLMADYTFKFTVVPAAVPPSDPGPTGTPTPQPTTSFQTTVNGVGVTVNGNQITAQQGVDLTMFLPGGRGIVPTSHGLLTMDVVVSPLKNIGTITGVHIGDQSSNTLNGGLATVTATADLDSLPSGSVSFTATVSDPTPADISAAREWMGRRSLTLGKPAGHDRRPEDWLHQRRYRQWHSENYADREEADGVQPDEDLHGDPARRHGLRGADGDVQERDHRHGHVRDTVAERVLDLPAGGDRRRNAHAGSDNDAAPISHAGALAGLPAEHAGDHCRCNDYCESKEKLVGGK